MGSSKTCPEETIPGRKFDFRSSADSVKSGNVTRQFDSRNHDITRESVSRLKICVCVRTRWFGSIAVLQGTASSCSVSYRQGLSDSKTTRVASKEVHIDATSIGYVRTVAY